MNDKLLIASKIIAIVFWGISVIGWVITAYSGDTSEGWRWCLLMVIFCIAVIIIPYPTKEAE